jgi:tRNA dimethylallyltransferase
MVEGGLIDEVRELIERGFGDRLTSSQAIGYAEFAGHLQGRSSREDAVEHTVKRTRNLARRQEAWLRRDPRIRWFRVGSSGAVEAIAAVGDYLAEGDA